MAHQQANLFVRNTINKYPFQLSGSGWRMMHDLKETSLYFTTTKKFTKDEARSVILIMNDEYIDQLNSCRKLRPFMYNFPFTENNISLSITFESNKSDSEPYLSSVLTQDGNIIYFYKTQDGNTIEEIESFSDHKIKSVIKNRGL